MKPLQLHKNQLGWKNKKEELQKKGENSTAP